MTTRIHETNGATTTTTGPLERLRMSESRVLQRMADLAQAVDRVGTTLIAAAESRLDASLAALESRLRLASERIEQAIDRTAFYLDAFGEAVGVDIKAGDVIAAANTEPAPPLPTPRPEVLAAFAASTRREDETPVDAIAVLDEEASRAEQQGRTPGRGELRKEFADSVAAMATILDASGPPDEDEDDDQGDGDDEGDDSRTPLERAKSWPEQSKEKQEQFDELFLKDRGATLNDRDLTPKEVESMFAATDNSAALARDTRAEPQPKAPIAPKKASPTPRRKKGRGK